MSGFDKVVVVPVLETRGQLAVVLVTSRTTGRWILPKGNLEPDLTLAEVAETEAWEEAGVRGSVRNRSLQHVDARIRGMPMRLACFLLDVAELANEWPEEDERERCVVALDRALELLRSEPGMRRVLGRMIAARADFRDDF